MDSFDSLFACINSSIINSPSISNQKIGARPDRYLGKTDFIYPLKDSVFFTLFEMSAVMCGWTFFSLDYYGLTQYIVKAKCLDTPQLDLSPVSLRRIYFYLLYLSLLSVIDILRIYTLVLSALTI